MWKDKKYGGPAEPPYRILSHGIQRVTGEAVAVSAAIATASAFLIGSNSVPKLYQIWKANGEGTLNNL